MNLQPFDFRIEWFGEVMLLTPQTYIAANWCIDELSGLDLTCQTWRSITERKTPMRPESPTPPAVPMWGRGYLFKAKTGLTRQRFLMSRTGFTVEVVA